MFDLCGVGDALIDHTPTEDFTRERPVYQANVGGTVCNLLSAAAKLGLKTVFAGKVGKDCMGELLRNSMEKHGIDLSGYVEDEDHFTTQAFVTLDEKGERNFSFSRKYGADIYLELNEIPLEKILDARMVHVAGTYLTDEPVRSTAFRILEEAKKRGRIITTDINYRVKLWKSEEEAIRVINQALPYLTIYKSSEEEALLVTGEQTIERAAQKLREIGCKMVIISCGEKGSYFDYCQGNGQVPSYRVEAVDTTGAGDCFLAGFLYQLSKWEEVENIPREEMVAMLRFANAAGALSVTKRGGVPSAPTLQEVQNCIKENKILDM